MFMEEDQNPLKSNCRSHRGRVRIDHGGVHCRSAYNGMVAKEER